MIEIRDVGRGRKGRRRNGGIGECSVAGRGREDGWVGAGGGWGGEVGVVAR